jgi:hypothetical protein
MISHDSKKRQHNKFMYFHIFTKQVRKQNTGKILNCCIIYHQYFTGIYNFSVVGFTDLSNWQLSLSAHYTMVQKKKKILILCTNLPSNLPSGNNNGPLRGRQHPYSRF